MFEMCLHYSVLFRRPKSYKKEVLRPFAKNPDRQQPKVRMATNGKFFRLKVLGKLGLTCYPLFGRFGAGMADSGSQS